MDLRVADDLDELSWQGTLVKLQRLGLPHLDRRAIVGQAARALLSSLHLDVPAVGLVLGRGVAAREGHTGQVDPCS